jgi:hypothetical protein
VTEINLTHIELDIAVYVQERIKTNKKRQLIIKTHIHTQQIIHNIFLLPFKIPSESTMEKTLNNEDTKYNGPFVEKKKLPFLIFPLNTIVKKP